MHAPQSFLLGAPKQLAPLVRTPGGLVPVPRDIAEVDADFESAGPHVLDDETLAEIAIGLQRGIVGLLAANHLFGCAVDAPLLTKVGAPSDEPARGGCTVVPGMLGTQSSGELVYAPLCDHWTVGVVWPPLADGAKESLSGSEGRSPAERGAGALCGRPHRVRIARRTVGAGQDACAESRPARQARAPDRREHGRDHEDRHDSDWRVSLRHCPLRGGQRGSDRNHAWQRAAGSTRSRWSRRRPGVCAALSWDLHVRPAPRRSDTERRTDRGHHGERRRGRSEPNAGAAVAGA